MTVKTATVRAIHSPRGNGYRKVKMARKTKKPGRIRVGNPNSDTVFFVGELPKNAMPAVYAVWANIFIDCPRAFCLRL
jgi:hypothetical protein